MNSLILKDYLSSIVDFYIFVNMLYKTYLTDEWLVGLGPEE